MPARHARVRRFDRRERAVIRRIVRGVAFVFVGVYLGVAGLLYVFQRDFLYYPDPRRPSAALARIPNLDEIELTTSDGHRLLAWYRPAPTDRPTVVFFHGNAGNIGDRAFKLARFVEAGFGILAPEYRGYGGNDGEPTEAGLYADANAAMDFLQREADGIIVYGESLGTGIATRVASGHRVAALVLEAPYTSITAMAAEQFPYFPVSLMLKDRFDSLSRIAQVRTPILIMQGEGDQVVPPALGRELFAAAPEPKQFWSSPEGGHDDLFSFGAWEIVADFLRRHIQSRA